MQDSMTQFPDGALPEDAQVDTEFVDTEQVDAEQVDTAQVDTVQVDTEYVDTEQVDAEQVDAEQVGTAQVDTVQAEFGGVEALQIHVAPAEPRQASAAVRVIPLDKTLAFNHCQTFSMFVPEQPEHRRILEQRYAETRLLPAVQDAMVHYPDTLSILALVDGEDPDTVAVLPIIARLLDCAPRIQLRVLADEDDLTALAMLLPELDINVALEEWDLPQFIVFDEDWEVQGQWGPRPAAVERNLEAWLARYPDYEMLAEDESESGLARFAELTEKLVQEMRIWYNSGLSADCQTEFCGVLTALQVPDDAGEAES